MKQGIISKAISAIVAAALTCTAMVAVFPVAGVAAAETASGEKSAMQEYVDTLQPGWNLGNTFDAEGGETNWGNPETTQEIIQAVADSGFKSLRLPVTWGFRTNPEDDYKITESFLERIKQVIDWSLEAGMPVMLNLHHDSEWIRTGIAEDHDEVMRKYKAIWTQIAEYFKDYPVESLMFETINEPRFSEDWGEDKEEYFQWVDELNVAAYEIIRASGGNNATRPIVMPTITCSTQQVRLDALAETMAELNDPNLIATIHYYSVWQFSVNVTGQTHFDDSIKKDADDMMDRLYDTFVSKGIPVIIGEFGLLELHEDKPDSVENGEAMKYFEYVTNAAQEKDIAIMLWDAGLYMNRETLEWEKYPILKDILINGAQGIRSSYAETDYIYVKEGVEPTDVVMPLTLNGNTLTGIRNGDTMLTAGTDYILSEDGTSVTFPAEFLKSVTADMEDYGTAARLFLEFSAGADWFIDVQYYKTPALRSMEDLAYDFQIPTQFNGDQLWTMEAYYTDTKKPAGTITYNTYQLFGTDFKPDYNNGSITLTKEFWNYCSTSGEILVRFYFRSGETVDYTIDFNKEATWAEGVSSNEYEIDYPGKNDPKDESSAADTSSQDEASENAAAVPEPGSDNTVVIIIVCVVAVVVIAAVIAVVVLKKKKK
ncbi:MAG TPA: cellulase family glycosylhydrolase [Firmicutes bacterium]|nr:cellulase family glycosylhydrolase [Bacillota bacterium]